MLGGMQQFLMRLLRASGWGAGLVLAAGCGSQVIGGGGGAPVDEAGNPLDETPAPECSGPVYDDDFGYHGQCCEEVLCTTPVDGVCASPETAALTGLPPGSGTCECSERSGPFQNADAADQNTCCYLVGSIGCDGRPLLVGGAPRLAEVVTGSGAWCAAPDGDGADHRATVAALDPGLRARLARRWTERARFEHASVASFARFSMALLACGAPPALVAASHRAALDEVRHAQVALAFASDHAGHPLDFGPLDIGGALDGCLSLEAVTVSTVIEGCVGETLAAIEVASSAAAARSGAVRGALRAIAEDETKHAELAWAFVRWAVGRGGDALRGRVAAAFAQAFERVLAGPVSGDEGAPDHGFLSGSEVASLRRQAIAEVLRPAAAALLSRAAPRASFVPVSGTPSHEVAGGQVAL